ncbi:MAG: N-6 DNA methylase [Oscillospiraceae bacterium]|nr:N-6 DNA methylase [Oscillospiraceae bacterium]
MCGFPTFQLEGYTERLRDKHDITISPTPVEGGERSAYTMRSFDHEAEKAVNEREAEFGADGYRAFPGNAPEEETPKNEAVFIGERGNTLYFYAPVSFGIETDFGDAPKLNEGQRMVVASPVCYHPADFLNAHKITFLKIGREIEEQQITQNGPSKQIDAMQEAMVYRTPENRIYQIGDVVDGVTGGNHLRFTIENVDADHVYADFPEVSDLVAMVRARFDAYLDDGRLNVVQEDTPAPAVEEPVPDNFPYSVGDTVYLEDGKPFVIEDVGIFDVHLRDPSLLFPVARSESKENFALLLERYPQPTADYTTEPVAEYPAEETGLPYDVVVQTIKATEPDPPAQNFRITDEHLGEGGAKAKFRANMDAIDLLHKLEAEGRQATPEEQEILSRFVGWGGLADAFDDSKPAWAEEHKELRSALTPEEYASARASTLNAHYTSPVVIRAVYEALSNMGFTGGNILEPSMGVGNFFGMLPNEMSGSKLYGVELDGLTGRIAKQLYPQADITVAGFETTDRSDFFDVAIGNVPFGQYQVNDPAYNKLGFNIHNYFFAKALDQVRPGGIVAFITSRYTLDSKDTAVRKYLAQRAELLGAIRLPNNAFKANAGTDVVSDIIFLQKRDRPITVEPDWIYLAENEDGYAINSYFLEHPEMILGQQSSESTQFGRMDFTVAPLEGVELKDQLAEAITHIEGTYKEAELPDLGEGEEIDTSIPADPSVKNYSYTLVDGEVYYRENSRMVKPNLNATAIERVKGMIALRNCLQKLIEKQMDGYVSDDEIRQIQVELNRVYDSFTAKYGLITGRANEMAFSDDSSYFLLCSLEILDEDRKLERKADIFTKRTIRPHEVVTSVDTASEALALSISEHASVDIPYMEELTGKTEEELVSDLRGVIFQVPSEQADAAREYQTADEYLSGNVRQKLRTAEEAAKNDSAFLPNVEALRKAQPKDLDASDIEVRLGATWIDKSVIEQFMYETFQTPRYLQWSCKVNYSPFTAEWAISAKAQCSYADVNAYVTYGTQRANAYKILEDALNLRDVRIYDTVQDADGKERRVLNSKETTLAQQKQQAIKDAFADWIWKDPERRQKLVAKYNELFNSDRPREYDGQHLAFPAMNPEIQLRGHQLNAVAHIIYGGNTLLAHEVGAGKTFEMVAAAMESKRLGLCQKPLFAVPNHLTEQWASEFLRLYPSANILVAKKKDFEPRNRKKFCARIATGNYDAVIIGHSQFERIPVSQARQERLLQDQIDEIEEGIVELKASRAERFTIKQLEKTKKSLEIKLKKLQDTKRKDDVVTFEELGVDRLYVDEAHNYKNLFLYTKMRNVAGLSTTDAQKSSDMLLKCRYLDEITGGKGVVFATGTPVSNSMTELYTMMRYLQHDTLRYRGLSHFDCWASTFGETATAIELAPEGTGYRARTRFSKFFNLPELMALFKQVADIKTSDQLNLPVPEAIYHNVVAQPTEVQQEMVQQLSKRASRVHAGVVAPTEDNMLKITSDGRKLGLDQRIINPDLPDDPQSKVNQCVDNVFRIWQEGEPQKLTQLIFCDLSTPSGKSTQSSITTKGLPESSELHAVESLVEEEPQEQAFCVYDDIREKLVARGVPREQIAFIHEANTDNRKAELFAKVRAGQVRVLLGSTFKMGAGMNVQDRLIALHDLDAPWRPGDLEQRSGRIVRQGNRNPQVHIYRYVTEATFDAYLWQTLENKQKFISQIMTSKSPVRSCEDVDETALSYAEIKALCAGDERIKEKMDLDIDVAKLKLMKASHNSQQYRLEDNLLKTFPEQVERFTGIIAGYQADMKTLSAHPHPTDGFAGMTVRSTFFNDKEAAGNALLSAMKDAHGLEPLPVGTYRGFKMYLTLEDFGREYVLTLKGELAHRVTLGKDARGNLTRIDNVLNAMPDRMKTAQAQLENVYKQIEAAKAELGKPFPQEEELRTKSARLAQLNAELDIDDKAPSEQLADDGEPAPSRDGVPLMEKLRQAKEAVQEENENRPQKPFTQEAER